MRNTKRCCAHCPSCLQKLEMPIDQEKLAKLQSAQRVGGKGAPRRKVVKKPKGAVAGGDDPKLQAAMKKLAVQPLTGIEEVNMFKADGNVLHIDAPKGLYFDNCIKLTCSTW